MGRLRLTKYSSGSEAFMRSASKLWNDDITGAARAACHASASLGCAWSAAQAAEAEPTAPAPAAQLSACLCRPRSSLRATHVVGLSLPAANAYSPTRQKLRWSSGVTAERQLR